MGKLIGQREDERDDGVLISGIDLEDIEADAFCFTRLVQEPVPLRLRQRRRYRIGRQWLEREHGSPQDRKTRSSRVIGS